MIFDVLGFGLATSVLLATFGKFFTDLWFLYTMIIVIAFEVFMCLCSRLSQQNKEHISSVKVSKTKLDKAENSGFSGSAIASHFRHNNGLKESAMKKVQALKDTVNNHFHSVKMKSLP